jgi:hypothetical protein
VTTVGREAQLRSAFACVRRVVDGAIRYELVLPAARLLGAEPLLAHEIDGALLAGRPTRGLRVAVSGPLPFAPIDDARGFGLVTLPHATRLGFESAPAVRHGMVRVTLVAALPETAWRLDEPDRPVAPVAA